MARSRNIKPNFFINVELGELKPITRLLFIGLWTVADREGRLKDQPQKIKVQILPYDKCNVDKLLDELQEKDFILRYKANGCGLIQIINFGKHQNPHMKEQASELPAPDLHHASTMQAPDKHGSCPADSLNLIPDTLNPLTDAPDKPRRGKFTPPTVNEIKQYCQDRSNNVDPEKFHDFYQAKGWMVGSNKMKDWRAAVRTWEKKDNQDNKFNPPEHRRL